MGLGENYITFYIKYRANTGIRDISAGICNSCVLHNCGIAVRFQAGE
jgi:hypothetical protein